MVQKILAALLVCVLLVLGVLWIINGGPLKAMKAASTLANPASMIGTGTTTGGRFELPWQIAIPQGPELSLETGDVINVDSPIEIPQDDPSLFGNPSPYANNITIHLGDVSGSDARSEYIQISADSSNTAPIAITGWSLQSAVTGVRLVLPMAAPLFVSGAVNGIQPVLLNPGATAIISSGSSPVGVSFQENMCSGYLEQYQDFVPSIEKRCPSLTVTNQSSSDDPCANFIDSLPACTFPTRFPSDVPLSCRTQITQIASYNGCVHTNQGRNGFTTNTWRLYLGLQSKLWNPNHDVIRLLDTEGRTVNAISY